MPRVRDSVAPLLVLLSLASTGSGSCALADATGGVPAPPGAPADPRTALCPGEVTPQPPLNAAIAGLGTDLLIATLPAVAGAFRRIEIRAVPAGHAGHYADSADATYAGAGVHLRVHLADMIRSCTGAAGSGDAMRDLEQIQDRRATRRRVAVGTRSGALVEWPSPSPRRRLVLWLGDRCQLSIDPETDASTETLVGLAGALGLSALETACRQR